MSDTLLYEIESVLLAMLLVGFGLAWAVRRLARTRPGLSIGTPVAVGVALRLVAIAAVSLTGLGPTLRSPDETTFLEGAREVAASRLDSGLWLPSDLHRLHELVFALQIKLGDFPVGALRVTQVGIAMLGIILIVTTIYDLAGPRAAYIAALVVALEPANIFFNSVLHREPILVLASGLIVLGGSKIWTKLELRGILLLGLGCVIALETRPYAGWLLITGGLLLVLHASVRQMGTRLRAVPLIYALAIAIAVATPTALALTSPDSLKQNLQPSQDFYTDPNATRGEANSNNLGLERVEFSTRSDLVKNLPLRVRDVLLRPYPWQAQNVSQGLGATSSLFVLAALFLLLRYAMRTRGRIFTLAAPIVYPALFLLVAYALSVSNAGTGFRYRTHLVLLGLAALVVLREHALAGEPTTTAEPGEVTERAEATVGRVGAGQR